MEALPRDDFTWRRFLALLMGLSPQSAYVNALAHERREREKDGGKRVIEDTQEATSYLLGLVTKKAG